jgi:hypothetical protein
MTDLDLGALATVDHGGAIDWAIKAAHREAGCPPWKPLLRRSWPHITARPDRKRVWR